MPKIRELQSEIPQYRKKSKGTNGKKSGHKHTYVYGIVLVNNYRYDNGSKVKDGKRRVLIEYCSQCGKIKNSYDWLEFTFNKGRYSELQKKVNDETLPVFDYDIDYVYELKYVGLGK